MKENKEKTSLSPSDAELFVRIAQKDVSALSKLYDRFSARLFGLSLKILNDNGLAEDVVQELFIYLWENAGKFDVRRGSPVSWLMVLCRNRCIDKLRSQTSRQKRTVVLDVELLSQLSSDESENPFETVNLNEVQKQITKALEGLPEEQRQPILMAYFEGMSQTEIADKLDVPLGTVKTRVRLGMQKLRNLMQPLKTRR